MLSVILWVHVLAGMLSLISGLIVFISRKGDKLHVLLGWLYSFFMFIVFVSGTYVSVLKDNLFLLLIGFFSFYMVHSGIQVNRFRESGRVGVLDRIFVVFYALIFLFIISISFLVSLKNNWTPAIILAVFGGLGASMSFTDIKIYFLKKEFSQKALIKDHIGKMCGSYIAAFTAFAVNNIHFIPSIIIWLAPTLFGTLLIIKFSKPYRE